MLDKINMNLLKSIVLEVGVTIMDIYKRDFNIEYKEDNSPLTEADMKANELICRLLIESYPNIPILSEENREVPYNIRKDWEYYWCIDPIDGTKEFINQNNEFTINIALIYQQAPVLGIVYAPALNRMYSAKKGEGAFLNDLRLPLKELNQFTVVASKSHLSDETQKFINELKNFYPELEIDSKGSSLKLCMIAEGSASIYPRIAPTKEWDTAAADAIVREVGKMTYIYDNKKTVTDYLENNNLQIVIYNKNNLVNPFFIVI